MSHPTVLFAGGGTLGHIVPAVAVARALQKRFPNVRVHFLCSPRGEDAFLKKEGLPFAIIDAPRMGWTLPWKFWSAYRRARHMLKTHTPAVVFSKGGYVALPVCLAARRLKIPIVLHESDAVSGRANAIVGRWADIVCTGFPSTHGVHTGNPVRPEITQGSLDEGLRITGFSGDRPVLLVIGGSQGAHALNEWVRRNLSALERMCDVIHITGQGKQLTTHYSPLTGHYYSIEFAHEELPHLYAVTDLAISRAGAGSIAELAANGIPTILVPLVGVAHNHQERNARSLQGREAVIVVTQNALDTELMNVVRDLIGNAERQKRMREAIHALHRPESAGQIAEILSRYLAGSRAGH